MLFEFYITLGLRGAFGQQRNRRSPLRTLSEGRAEHSFDAGECYWSEFKRIRSLGLDPKLKVENTSFFC